MNGDKKFGFESKPQNRGDFVELVDNYVRIDLNGNYSRIGFLKEATENTLTLKPYLIDESLSYKISRRIETEKSAIISIYAVQSVNPIKDNYIKEVVEEADLLNKEIREKRKRDKLMSKLNELEAKIKIKNLKDQNKKCENIN